MNRLTAHFPLVIVALLAIASFWLEQVVRNEHRESLGKQRHDPDTIVERFAIDHFDTSGKLQSRLTASQLLHYPDDDTADITSPVLTLTRDERPVVFTSQRARASNTTKVVVLQGSVRGERQATSSEPAQILTTEELTVFTDEEIARTSLPVLYTQGSARLDGIGAEWNNLDGLLQIHSQVRGEFPPRPSPPQP